MPSFAEMKNNLLNSEIKKSWIYLLYIYLALPLVLFVLAWALRSAAIGITFGVLFHNYGLFIASTIPSPSLTGVVGLVLGIFFTAKAARKRDWLDLGICLGLLVLNTAYYYLELNYKLLPFIRLP